MSVKQQELRDVFQAKLNTHIQSLSNKNKSPDEIEAARKSFQENIDDMVINNVQPYDYEIARMKRKLEKLSLEAKMSELKIDAIERYKSALQDLIDHNVTIDSKPNENQSAVAIAILNGMNRRNVDIQSTFDVDSVTADAFVALLRTFIPSD